MAADADPETGYSVRVDGQNTVIGGTSAVAPLVGRTGGLLEPKPGQARRFSQPDSLRATRRRAASSETSPAETTAPTQPAPAGTPAPASASLTDKSS